MSFVALHPHDETAALRRATALLARVSEDGPATKDLEALEAAVNKLWATASRGHEIRRTDVDRVEAALARVEPFVGQHEHATVGDLLLQNALCDTRELITLLKRSASRLQ